MEQARETTREFKHRKDLYISRVYGEGLFALFASLFSLYKLQQSSIFSIWLVIFIVAVYSLIRLFVSKSVPERIEVEKDRIVFQGLGTKREFTFSGVKSFKIKEFKSSKTLYLRVKDKKTHKFWIEFNAYSDSEDLNQVLLQIEEMIHPDSLKAKIKANNNRYQKVKSSDVS